MQHSSRHIGPEWGSSKDRCWQCLPLALWSMVWRRGMRGATYMLPTLWWICCLHRTKWDWLHNIKWNCESKWKVDFEEIKSLKGTAIFEKIRGLYEIGGVWKRLALCAIWWLRILKGWGFSKNQDLGGAVTRFEDVSSLTKTALFSTLWLRILEEWWFWSSEDQ